MPHAYLPKRKSGTGNTFPRPSGDRRLGRAGDSVGPLGRINRNPYGPATRLLDSRSLGPALVFDRALYETDQDHKLHKIIRGEWRGLLALIGLRERRNFESFSVRPVSLSSGSSTSFISVLTELLPRDQDMLSPESSWREFHILRWQMRPYAQNRPRAFGFSLR